MQDRENALKEWLINTLKHENFTLKPLAGDASFRRYFRLEFNENTSLIAMDAPPDKENLEPFIHVANILAQAGILTPEILAINKTQGFLLLSDFGDQLLLSHLSQKTVDYYYQTAIQTLFKMQSGSAQSLLPSFNKTVMINEMNLCIEWFFKEYLSLVFIEDERLLIQNSIRWIAEEVSLQPQTFIHRDYHSRNLMIVNNQQLGVIDFQDAMKGPLTYDLVSLLKDCYMAWPREKILQWVNYFYHHTPLTLPYSMAEFIRAFDLCGIQRHIKVLGVFSRLFLRDKKSGYLKDLPLTLKYVLDCAETYEELHPFFHLLQTRVKLP